MRLDDALRQFPDLGVFAEGEDDLRHVNRALVVGQHAGWELLEQLHAGAATCGVPTLVVSTDRRLLTLAQEQAERYGTHRYLEKPFDLDAVLTQIQEMIGEA